MTEIRDEKMLDRYIQGLEKKDIIVPPELGERINKRIAAVPSNSKRIKALGIKGLAAALLFVTLFGFSVRLSPGFAAYASNLPVLKIAVGWLAGDTGTEHAKEQGYHEIDGVIVEENGYVLEFSNIMFDEDRLVMSVTVNGEKMADLPQNVQAMLDIRYMDFAEQGGLQQVNYEPGDKASGLVQVRAEKVFHADEVRDFLAANPEYVTIHAALVIRQPGQETQVIHEFGNIQIPFEQERILLSHHYSVEETVVLDKAALTVEELIVSPTRMRVDVSFELEEGYYFTAFENPHVRDEAGNIYQAEGLVSSHRSLNERSMFFVPSIYFADTVKELYFSFDGLWLGAEEDGTFTLALDAEYPQTITFMGEEMVIEEVSYAGEGPVEEDGSRQGPGESLVVELRMPENIKVQGLEIDGVRSSHGFSSGLDEDGRPRPQFYGLDVEYKPEYEVTLLYAGRLIEGTGQSIRMK